MNASLPQGKSARTLRAVLSAGILVFAVACNEEDSMAGSFKDDLPQSGEAQLVYDVTDISVEEVESAALQVIITATGHTRTGGWTDVRLVLDDHASEPGHLVYRFVAMRPAGMATQMIASIQASTSYFPTVGYSDPTSSYLPTVGRVEVIAETNSMTYDYPGSSQE